MSGNGLTGYTVLHHVEGGQVVESGVFGPNDELPEWAVSAASGDDEA